MKSLPALFLILVGMAAAADAPKPAGSSKSAKMVSAAVPDGELERSIKARFARSKINADGFTVKVKDGTAVIEGKTDVIQHKGTATRLAHSAGARDVRNNIQISEAARQKARANLDKARRKAEVKRNAKRSG